MKIITQVLLGLALLIPTLSYAEVIEVATFTLKEGVTYEAFAPIDKAVEVEHVAKQAGFISREAAKGKNGEWLVIVHWASEEDAVASMNSFMQVPAAADFMAKIDAPSMVMKHYTK